ncbi:MAG: hypothetical protein QM817_27410 [Archangium sp.]
MTMLALLVLSAAPSTFVLEEGEPAHFALFSTKPNPDKNSFGKVLPAFASAKAFAASKHPLLEKLSADQRAALGRASSTSKETVSITVSTAPAELTVPFMELSDVKLAAATKPVVTRVIVEGCCDGQGKPEDIGFDKVFPASVFRDSEKRVRALVRRSEQHVSHDNHETGPVTEKNASQHRWTVEVFEFDEKGRLVTYVRMSRADNEMRYLPYIELDAFALTWSETRLESVSGISAVDDPGESFDVLARTKTWKRAP